MTLSSPAGQRVGLPETTWQEALRAAVRSIAELEPLLGFAAGTLESAAVAESDFPLLVPRGFVARMRRNDLGDPLLRQVLPLVAEREAVPGFGDDPLGEQGIARGGVLRKYAGRALLVTSAACPVHCRYCFRRAFPYASQLASRADFGPALEALGAARDVREVILSGGDPLSLSNRKLGILVAALERLPHLTTLRVHTRFPVMIPQRVDAELVEILSGTRLDVVVVVHANHANELDAEVASALGRLKPAARALLNQSVLLRGVNDDADTLTRLSERLLEAGVLPYYLHLLDAVTGAAHFSVAADAGVALIDRLRARLPGYLVPRLVKEMPGELSKTPIDTSARRGCDLRTIAL
jgi:EF-P beta-lysylation protein EpmB